MKERCTGDDTHTAISRFWVGNFQIIWMSTGQREILCQCPFYCLMCRRWPRDSAETRLYLWYSSWGVWKHQPQLCCRVIIPRNSRSGTAHSDYVPLYLFPVLVSPHFLLRRAFWFPEDQLQDFTQQKDLSCHLTDHPAMQHLSYSSKGQVSYNFQVPIWLMIQVPNEDDNLG